MGYIYKPDKMCIVSSYDDFEGNDVYVHMVQ